MTGLDYESFTKLLHKFQSKWHGYTFDESTMVIRKKKTNIFNLKGRPRDLDAVGGLGLVLVWFRTKGPCNRVALFGSCSSHVLFRRVFCFCFVAVPFCLVA